MGALRGSVRILCHLDSKCQAFSSSAALEVRFNLSNWSEFGGIALVTDVEWTQISARLLAPFLHRPLRIFAASELNAASA